MPFQIMDVKPAKRSLQSYESNQEDSDADGDTLVSLTLKEIKKRSKKKKRKLSELPDIVKQENETSSLGCIFSCNHEGKVQLKENPEVVELLDCFKLKLSKKPRSKRKIVAKGTNTSSNASVHIETPTEQNLSYQSLSLNTVDRHEALSHDIVTLEPVNLDPKNVVNVTDGSSSASYVIMSCEGERVEEIPGGANQSELDVGESPFVCKGVLNFVVNEVSKDYLMPEESSTPSGITANSVVITKASSPEIQKFISSVASECLEETTITHSVLDFSPTSINDQDFEEHPCFQQGNLPNGLENNTSIGMSDKTSLQCKVLHCGGDRSVPDIDDMDDKEDASDTKSNDVNNKLLSDNPDMITTDIHQLMKVSDGCGGCNINTDNESDSKVVTPDFRPTFTNSSVGLSSSTQDLDQSFSRHIGSCLEDDASHTSEKKHSSPMTTGSLLGCVDAAVKGSSGSHSDARSALKRALEVCLSPTTEYSPKRLFATRKVISPTSQEKLCRDLNGGESHSMQILKCREKLSFEKQTECENALVKPGAEGGDVSMIKQNIKKSKNNKNISSKSVPRGILKVPPFSCSSPSIGNECASVSGCAQKAIEFSQRQMHDMESLAIKLMKELKSMKDIAEETLCHEVCQPASSKYTADQIKSSIEDVAKAEETTKKWLSIMSRDCTRFCKIMKSSEKKSLPASGSEDRKKKKNITFADKDGGILCHVKLFEDTKDLPVVSKNSQHEYELNIHS